MLSNQKDENTRRKKSIKRRIQWLFLKERVGRLIGTAVLIGIVFSFGYIGCREFEMFGRIDLRAERLVMNGGEGINPVYIVNYGAAATEIPLKGPLILLQYFETAYFVIGGMSICIRTSVTGRKVKRILAPIDEIATRADELYKLGFSDEKYHLIENALEEYSPDEAHGLELHDDELSGIEQAFNNLLYRIQESNKQQARFVNDASHELRTPIAVIEGYANMLTRWGKDDEKVLEESITAIKNESEHMKHLVEQLLFLARGDSGRTKLTYENINVTEMMQEIYEESLMIDENHTYRFNKGEGDIFVNGDGGMLKQAVRILIDNAAKYTTKGDDIILKCGLTDNNDVCIQVQDTGIGMSGEDVAHMFERFFRADKARNTEGTGLGLAIAKWIVDKHKGHFEITSRTELGTRISIIIPHLEQSEQVIC